MSDAAASIAATPAADAELVAQVKAEIEAVTSDMVRWRRHIHRHPELQFKETETAKFILAELEQMGYDLEKDVRSGIATTGIVCCLHANPEARRATNDTREALLLRADMDALPITEVVDDHPLRAEYRSVTDEAMHACGHDGHCAMMLAAARVLRKEAIASRLTRDVAFLFQPAEECGAGGNEMIKAGALEVPVKVGAAFALHLLTVFPVGEVQTRVGPLMAASDTWYLTIRGKGGHAGLPHLCVTPIAALGACIAAVNTIVSRNIDPLAMAVVTIGQVHAGTTENVIPDTATMSGTVRTLEDAPRDKIMERLEQLLTKTCEAFGCEAEYRFEPGYPATVNHQAGVDKVHACFNRHRVGSGTVAEPTISTDTKPMAPTEDFSYFLREKPGAFVLVGCHDPETGLGKAPHHKPSFDIDERSLPIGAELLVSLALDRDGI